MNEELIQRLVDQCLVTRERDGRTVQVLQSRPFAELIVRECAKRVDYWESRQGEHADDLLKHFGVEE